MAGMQLLQIHALLQSVLSVTSLPQYPQKKSSRICWMGDRGATEPVWRIVRTEDLTPTASQRTISL